MRDLGKLFSEFKGRRGASAAAIAECERHFGRELPKDYRDFLMIINGGEGFIGPNSYLMLWKVEELPSMNDGYETTNYLPHCVLFGSSGGGEAYGFDIRTSQIKIVKVPLVGMEWGLALPQSNSFREFLFQLYEV